MPAITRSQTDNRAAVRSRHDDDPAATLQRSQTESAPRIVLVDLRPPDLDPIAGDPPAPLARLADRGHAHRRLDGVSTYQSLERYQRVSQRLVLGPGLLQSVVLGAHLRRRELTVRPLARYAEEGPSVWKMNYLAPIRLCDRAVLSSLPDPRTLLVIQNIVFWWVIPAAYTLVRSESRSQALAVSAALLVPLTPVFWPLVWNDFRELQLAAPFVLWAVQGVRSRSSRTGGAGNRRDARLPAGVRRHGRDVRVLIPARARVAERHAAMAALDPALSGSAWFFFGFLGYLRFVVGRNAPEILRRAVLGSQGCRSPGDRRRRSTRSLIGMGAWAVLACFAPASRDPGRAVDLGPVQRRVVDGFSRDGQWHHVRYAHADDGVVLAAGLIGYARVGAGS